ncbi:hypothetical protein [Parasphingorhabdus pacifica]
MRAALTEMFSAAIAQLHELSRLRIRWETRNTGAVTYRKLST